MTSLLNRLDPRLVAGLLVMLSLGGCGLSRTPREVRYYTLSLELPAPSPGPRLALASVTPSPGAGVTPPPLLRRPRPTLSLRRLVVRDPYAQERMVYRASPYRVLFYNYQRWAAAPAEQLTDWTLRYLRATGLFSKILTTQEGDGDLVLTGVVRQLEEVDRHGVWYGALTLDLALNASAQATSQAASLAASLATPGQALAPGQPAALLWSQSYHAEHAARRRNPEAVAEALSICLQEILERATRDLAPSL